jgi:4-hydroxy-2-oxoheptanedioate aldolase
MTETPESLANLDDILSVPGIDAVFIGPNDLHNSLGLPPAFESDDPRFVRGLERVLELARNHGVAPGIHVADAEMAKRRLAQGFQFIAVSSETGFMLSKTAEVAKALGLGTGTAAAKY